MKKYLKKIPDSLWLLLILSPLFLIFLGNHPLLVPDEARYVEIPREMLATGQFIIPHLDGLLYLEKPPLFYWFEAFAIHLFGLQFWGLRLVTALLAMIGCGFVFFASKRLFDRKTAWFVALILATSLLYYLMGHFISMDMTVSIMITGCLLTFLLANQAIQTPSGKAYMVLSYAFAGLAVLAKGLIGIFFPGMIVLLWLIFYRQWRNMRFYFPWIGIVVFLAIALPWHILSQMHYPDFFHHYFINQQFTRYLDGIDHDETSGWFLPASFFLGLFPWGIFFIFAIIDSLRSKSLLDPKIGFLLIWIVSVLVFFQLSYTVLIPYVLPALPAAAILIGNYLAKMVNTKNKLFKVAFLISLGFCLFVGMCILFFTLKSNSPLVPQGMPAYFILASMLILTVVVTVLLLIKYQPKTALIGFLVFIAFTFLSMNFSVPYVNNKSVRPLAQAIEEKRQPHDKVIAYHYLRDLPVYLNHNVDFVFYSSEMDYGLEHTPNYRHHIPAAQFWKWWRGPEKVFLLVDQRILPSLLSKLGDKYEIVKKTSRFVLLVNHSS